MKLFNTVIAPALFSVKTALLTAAIFGGYGAIRIADRQPTLGACYGLAYANILIAYTALFQLPYQITEDFENLKNAIKLKTAGSLKRERQEYSRLYLRSLPDLSILVGSFYPVEREAVPVFIDFVNQQILDLLLTF